MIARGRTLRPRVLASVLAVCAAVGLVLSAATVLRRPDVVDDRASFWVYEALSVPVAALAVVLLLRLPRHPLTWVLSTGVVLSTLVGGAGQLGTAVAPESTATTALSDLGWLGGIPMLPLLFVVYDGWPRDRWRHLARAVVAALAVLVVISVVRNEVPVRRPVDVLAGACGVVLTLAAVVGAIRLALRARAQRRSHPEHTPFAAAAVLVLVTFFFLLPALDAVQPLPGELASTLAFSALVYGPPMTLGYGVLRHQLFGVDVVVRRVALAAASAVALFALYLLGVLAVGAILDVPRSTLSAGVLPAAVAVVLLAPAHRRAQAWAERRLYGERRDPRSLLTHLAAELAASPPDQVAALLARRTAEGLRLPWAAVELDREGAFVQVAEHGRVTDSLPLALAVTHADETVGRLVAQPRRGQPELGPRDLRALEQVAVQAAPALSAVRLVDELTASRERLVLDRESERARLRRELHDGLSPSLAGMSLALGAARSGLGRGVPPEVDRLLTTVQEEAVQAAHAVRTLLDDLRPPGLEELGLLGALEDRARQLTRPTDFAVSVVAADLPALPASVEVAAYRIATEAMTNAARHSGGRHCRVELSVNGRLELRISDDGCGLAGGPGVGIGSMTERARELGGRLSVTPGRDGGTVVEALLPVTATP